MTEDNGTIEIDTRTQQEIKIRRLKIKQFQDEILLILNTVLNVKGKAGGNYESDKECTRLKLIKKEK